MNDRIPGNLKVWTILYTFPPARRTISKLSYSGMLAMPLFLSIHQKKGKWKNYPGNPKLKQYEKMKCGWCRNPLKMLLLLPGFLYCDGAVYLGDVDHYRMWQDQIFLAFPPLWDWSHTLTEGLCIWFCHNSKSMSCASSWSSPFWFFVKLWRQKELLQNFEICHTSLRAQWDLLHNHARQGQRI